MQDSMEAGVVYVFVCVKEPPDPPMYYIATAEEARPKVKQYATRGTRERTGGSA
jgi:hypothetical protein